MSKNPTSSHGLRKRVLVTEGDLYQLWCEIEQIRREEKKELYHRRFKELLHESFPVEMTVRNSKANKEHGHE